ncbi:MAG: Uncharacterised protein [Crocinitomicaceae bacterium]|nr:MAG: Uncharacterised protein [Crocinitomicaceae bacterium]
MVRFAPSFFPKIHISILVSSLEVTAINKSQELISFCSIISTDFASPAIVKTSI